MRYLILFIIVSSAIIFLTFFIPINQNASEIEPGSFLDQESIYVDGQEWSFITEPPPESERTVRSSHPRLMLTQENIPKIREKLRDPVYEDELKVLRKEADYESSYSGESNAPLAQAFMYAVFDDQERGQAAKKWLLKGEYGQFRGYARSMEFLAPVLVYDWIHSLLNDDEKESAVKKLQKYWSNKGYNHRSDPEPDIRWYYNDRYSRHLPLYYVHLAFAIHGDGVADEWAEEVISLAYNDNGHVLGPYSVKDSQGNITSGMLDALMTISLDDGGGEQTSDGIKQGGGYWGMYLNSFYPLSTWESATKQDILSKANFFRKIPSSYIYSDWPDEDKFAQNADRSLEYVTGVYKNIDQDEATLAKWMLNKYGRAGRYSIVFRLIYGDMRIDAQSPQELSLPTTNYIKGMDRFTSRTKWNDNNSVVVSVLSRYLDFARFEPSCGLYGIYKNNKPLLVRGSFSKFGKNSGGNSGLWIYNSIDDDTIEWGQVNHKWQIDSNIYPAVSKTKFFHGGPDRWEANQKFRAITQEYSRLYNRPVNTARHTLIHIPDGEREFVVVYYHADVGGEVKTAQSMRLVEEPSIQENTFTIPGMHVTAVSPDNPVLTWVGGYKDELRSPPPERMWLANTGRGNFPGYSENPRFSVEKRGLGNLYIQPQTLEGSNDYLSVIQVSDLEPLPVTKISERKVQFADWKISFSPSGEYSVEKINAD